MCVAKVRHFYVRSFEVAFVCAKLWGGICICVAIGRYLCLRSYGSAFVCA